MPPDGTLPELNEPSLLHAAVLTLVHDVEVSPASAPAVYIDHTTQQVLSLEPVGDVFYGLLPGTNGTGATCRRLCAAPAHYTWIASDCRRARGVLSVPSDRSDGYHTNPWSGRC